MKTIPAGQFKAHCLKIMDGVCATREPVVNTKRGRAVARLVPAQDRPTDVLGCLADIIEIVGDIESPVTPPGAWKPLASPLIKTTC